MNLYDFAEKGKWSLDRIHDFATGVNPLGPSHKAARAVRKEAGRLEFFPDEKARYLKRYLCRIEGLEEDRILFGAGSTHLLGLLMDKVKPEVVGLLSPCSQRVHEILAPHSAGIELIPTEGDGKFSIPVKRLCDRMKEVDMLILGNPHHMTGTAISGEDLSTLISEAAAAGTILVIDEAFRDYTTVVSPVREVAESASAVILRTFSLYHGFAALRLGYMIGPSGLIRKIEPARPSAQISSLALRAAQASLRDREHRERTFKFVAEEKAYFSRKLSTVPGVDMIDTPCNFVLLRMKGEWEALGRELLAKGIMIEGFQSENDDLYVRLPVGRHKSNAYFMRSLRKILGG
ncbi:MAG TPA: histidinol-phosphate transaminase [Syntrophorhabdaceae bacterium]|jgi:histidinol-phosphate/aromatic aminotransferase/cobyric acid decarboxylase-like protein